MHHQLVHPGTVERELRPGGVPGPPARRGARRRRPVPFRPRWGTGASGRPGRRPGHREGWPRRSRTIRPRPIVVSDRVSRSRWARRQVTGSAGADSGGRRSATMGVATEQSLRGARSKITFSRPRQIDGSFDISSFTDLGVSADITATGADGRERVRSPFRWPPFPPRCPAGTFVARPRPDRARPWPSPCPSWPRLTPARPRRPRALILVPTRELASQVHDVLGSLLGHERRRVVSIFGGTGYRDQCRALHKGVNVVVACPGRLEDLIGAGTCGSTT